jgi:hypothetical protein
LAALGIVFQTSPLQAALSIGDEDAPLSQYLAALSIIPDMIGPYPNLFVRDVDLSKNSSRSASMRPLPFSSPSPEGKGWESSLPAAPKGKGRRRPMSRIERIQERVDLVPIISLQI